MKKKKDVIVIGAGCAGMVAALAAQAEGAHVAIIDRGPIGKGSNSALAGGKFAGPMPGYGYEEYIRDTLQTGRGINCESLVRVVACELPDAISFLRSMGVDVVESSNRYCTQSSRADVIPGVTLVGVLAQRIRQLRGIDVLTGIYVTEILKEGERVCGVSGFDREGREMYLSAPAVVLATGGAGAIYLRNGNQKNAMGQGYYLASKAGLELWDMEFVQFFPLVMAETGLPLQVLYPPLPKEARIIDGDGQDVFERFGIGDPNEALIRKRDEFAAVLFKESLRGPIFIDYRGVPAAAWEKNPLSLIAKIKFDFRNKPVAVSPGAHFFMGGLRTDERAQTSVPGFFACGEVAWGIHGANRMGGNALAECAVFGRIAGRNAAWHGCQTQASSSRVDRGPGDVIHSRDSTSELLRKLLQQAKEIAWRSAGVVRSETGLKQGLAELKKVELAMREMLFGASGNRRLRQDLESTFFVLNAVLMASLSREESRGAFKREEFPEQDDLKWRRNSCLRYEPETHRFLLDHHSAE